MTFPPVTLPAALTPEPALKLLPITLPDALICPLAAVLPLTTLPLTARLPRVPTEVKLLNKTFALNVFPVSNAAAPVETTPVNCDPLPMKNCPAVMLPVAEIAELPINVPVTVAPVEVTAITFAMPCGLINIAPLFKMLILLVPFEIPLTPPRLNKVVKLLLVLVNAVRRGSPAPSLAVAPMLIISCDVAMF